MKIIDLEKIETSRLIIRPVQLGDEVEISAAINRSLEPLQRWMPWAKDPSFETTKKFVENAVKNRSTSSLINFPLVVVHKGDNKIISATGFNEKSEFDIGVYEIGYWVDMQYQGQGFVTEFVTALTRFSFEYLSAIRVQIVMQVENEKSVSVAKRCGFRCEATMKNHRIDCVSGSPADSYLYVLTNGAHIPQIDYSVGIHDQSQDIIYVTGESVSLIKPTKKYVGEFIEKAKNSQSLHKHWTKAPESVEAYNNFMSSAAKENQFSVLIKCNNTNEIAGVINISEIVRGLFQSGYLGYYLFSGFEKRGLMQEAINLLIEYAFANLNLHRLEANIQPGNSDSISLVKKCGFVQEGLSKRYLYLDGEWRDHCRFAITPEMF